MSAVMWEVVRQRNIKHYGKLEEFVSMVTDAVPELMSKREGRLLSLGLRARVSGLKCCVYKVNEKSTQKHQITSCRQPWNCCDLNILKI